MQCNYNDGTIHGWNGGEYPYEVFRLIVRLVELKNNKNDAVANTARDLLYKWDTDRSRKIT